MITEWSMWTHFGGLRTILLLTTFWHHLYKIINKNVNSHVFFEIWKKRKLRLEHCCTVAWRASSATAERLNCYLYIQITSYDPAIPSQSIVSSLTRSEWNSRKGASPRGGLRWTFTPTFDRRFVFVIPIGLLGFSRSNSTWRLLVSTT